jgi:hypothetical protein
LIGNNCLLDLSGHQLLYLIGRCSLPGTMTIAWSVVLIGAAAEEVPGGYRQPSGSVFWARA